jgi:hypothetical protein
MRRIDMAFTVRVKVLRHMNGDDGKGGNKAFEPGDFRSMPVADAERLAATGAVEIVSKPANAANRQAPKKRGAKAVASAPANKAVKSAPANKAAPRRRRGE